jgi:hypothetical protein
MTMSSYAPSAPPTCIAWFDDVSRRDVASVGGKGANLGELTQAGFAVPPGFVVTAGAYVQALNDRPRPRPPPRSPRSPSHSTRW